MPKWLWCENCQEFPDDITEMAEGGVKNIERWDEKSSEYRTVVTDSSGWIQYCGVCGEELDVYQQQG